nr:NDP-sugar synthase [Thermoleophilaceae bacterium]
AALEGRLRVEWRGEERQEGLFVSEGAEVGELETLSGSVWVGAGARIGDGARLMGPVVIGDGAGVGAGASLRDTIIFPGTDVEEGAIVVGGTLGHTGIVESLRPRSA